MKYILLDILHSLTFEKYPYLIHICSWKGSPIAKKSNVMTIERPMDDRDFGHIVNETTQLLKELNLNYTMHQLGGDCRIFLYKKADVVLFRLSIELY